MTDWSWVTSVFYQPTADSQTDQLFPHRLDRVRSHSGPFTQSFANAYLALLPRLIVHVQKRVQTSSSVRITSSSKSIVPCDDCAGSAKQSFKRSGKVSISVGVLRRAFQGTLSTVLELCCHDSYKIFIFDNYALRLIPVAFLIFHLRVMVFL